MMSTLEISGFEQMMSHPFHSQKIGTLLNYRSSEGRASIRVDINGTDCIKCRKSRFFIFFSYIWEVFLKK